MEPGMIRQRGRHVARHGRGMARHGEGPVRRGTSRAWCRERSARRVTRTAPHALIAQHQHYA
eukprot:scaffold99440_cov63-Phaeocystis_antarctica.AAC.5